MPSDKCEFPCSPATTVDIDLHRFKCTECQAVFYYSSRAREFFEEGIECETYGLTTYNLLKYDGIIPKDYERF